MAEPPSKKARTDEEPEAAKEPEPPQEAEEDEAPDSGPRVGATVAFHTEETTMNCITSSFGSMLMPLTDGGLQYLLAGARANVGLKSGRYFFEVKIVECQHPMEDLAARTKLTMTRNQLRVGWSTARSPLFLGETEESICFCMDGTLMHNKTRETLQGQVRFLTGDVMAVLLNLNKDGPNANTISVFKNGERMCQPQALPQSLQGKTLFPTVTIKNIVVHYNFGPAPLFRLPFVCRMVADASKKDCVVATPAKSKDKQEVLFPVGLPDEGTFDWLDMFMAEHDGYTELSDRAVLQWAEKSGLARPKGTISAAASELVGQRNCNDKPDMGFGIATMDDGSVRRVLHAVAPIQQRDYIVMEVRSNLVKEDRKELLAKWAGSTFKRTAVVVVGEPPLRFKKKSQELALRDKQQVVNEQFKVKKAEEKRKKVLAKKQRKFERERKKAEKLAKEKQEALTKKLEEERRRKERAAAGESPEEKKEEVAKETTEAKPDEDDEESEDEDEEEKEEDPPKAELTAEEKKLWFRKKPAADLNTYVLNTAFMKFSLPDEKEGFDNLRYEWSKAEPAQEYLRQWVRDRKATTRVEDLQPSDWFKTRWKDWQQTNQTWHAKQNQHKAALAKKVVNAATKAAKKKEPAKEEKGKENGSDANKTEEGKEQEKPKEAEPAAEEAEEPEPPAVDFEHLDVFGVEDVLDIGGGQPLFSAFNLEDWTMLSLRFELYLLTHAFRIDVNDPDRLGIHLEHMPFYYNKYFKKSLNTKFYGVENLKELMALVRDTVVVRGKSDVIETQLPEEMESYGVFAMLTEESRRDRMRRVDLGDESAKLKLAQTPPVTSTVRQQQPQQQQQQQQLQQQHQQHQQQQQPQQPKPGSSGGATTWQQQPSGWKNQMVPTGYRPWVPNQQQQQAWRW